jgi:hypothetical protein
MNHGAADGPRPISCTPSCASTRDVEASVNDSSSAVARMRIPIRAAVFDVNRNADRVFSIFHNTAAAL